MIICTASKSTQRRTDVMIASHGVDQGSAKYYSNCTIAILLLGAFGYLGYTIGIENGGNTIAQGWGKYIVNIL